jgi:lariat debranching enzyme
VRNVDVYRLKCLSKSKSRLDIMMSHDWPLGIEQHGDTDGLIRRKPFFRKEIEENDLGSPPNREVMDTVKPKWWFSAHLHVKFRASLDHNKKNESTSHTAQDSTGKPSVTAKKSLSSPTSSSFIPSQVSQAHVDKVKSEDETNATDNNHDVPKDTTNNNDMKEESENVTEEQDNSATEFIALASNSSNRCTGPDLTDLMTQFLALDKCLPRRQYLSILNVPTDITKADAVLEYDPDWLAILRKTHDLTCTERKNVTVPDELIDLTDSDIEWVEARIKEQSPSSDLSIPENFSATVPEQSHPMFQGYVPPIPIMGNPQTDALLKILELEHVLTVPYSTEQTTRLLNPESYRQPIQPREPDMNIMVEDENEIDLGLEEDGVDDNLDAEDENEIDIDDDNIMVDGEDEEKEEESPPAPDGGKVESAPAKKPRLDDE